ncbi:MAG: hypothetical protein HOV81_25005 [Kofleriaceae bacterium]|nr:hypothetical protein [Kofleriaceae bacterium]
MHRDHEDLDRVLIAMVEPHTSREALLGLLDGARLAFSAHIEAEAEVMQVFMARSPAKMGFRRYVGEITSQHRAQDEALHAIRDTTPGSTSWYFRVLELRVLVLDHASREPLMRATLAEHISLDENRQLARDYAAARMRMLAMMYPFELARKSVG